MFSLTKNPVSRYFIEARDELERAAEMFGMSEELIDWPPEPRARTPA